MKKIIIAILLIAGQTQAAQLERLMGYVFDQDGVIIQVSSGGCTRKSDFVVVKGEQANNATLSFYRKTLDTCLALVPYGEQFYFTNEELGLGFRENFLILNKVSSLKK